jgi:uncharacterized membrane protein
MRVVALTGARLRRASTRSSVRCRRAREPMTKETTMDRELVIIVATEVAAYDAVKALQDLDRDGSIELYDAAVLARRADGTIDVLDRRDEGAPAGAIGAVSGALIGMLGGPAGAVFGALVGGGVGLAAGAGNVGLTGDFVNDTAAKLVPGTFAVCANVLEDWTVPVDTAVAPLKAIVLRQATEDVAAAQLDAETQSLEDEWAQFESEVKQAKGDARTKLEAQRASLQAKQAARRAELEQRAAGLQARWDAKMKAMDDKAAKKDAEIKARHQRHHDQLAQLAKKQRDSLAHLFV